jgi:hypothetical protein
MFPTPKYYFWYLGPLRNVVSATKFIVVKIPAMQRNVKFIGGYHEHVKNNDLNTCRLL